MIGPLFTQFAASCQGGTFFGLEPWYKFLNPKLVTPPGGGQPYCDVSFGPVLGTHSGILLVLLAVVDDLLRIAGVVAVGYIIYGGIKYIASQGNPDQAAQAQSTIVNALVGLVVAIVAVAFVAFIGNHIGVTGP